MAKKSAQEPLSVETVRELIGRASAMLAFSYIPYSGFAVGAALLCDDGTIVTGCNVENAAYGPSICAERTAFVKAVSEGKSSFRAIAIVGGKDRVITDYCPPCGVCRQVMAEFCDTDTFFVITAKSQEDFRVRTLGEYLPESFGGSHLRDRLRSAGEKIGRRLRTESRK